MRIFLLCILCCLPLALPAGVALAGATAETEVRHDFETVLDLWRDGRFEELYDRTYSTGKLSRETFVRKLAATGVKPACCWEKLREACVTVSDGGKAELYGTVGLDTGGTATEFCTRSFRLRKKAGVWKVSASDLLSLARSATGKVRRP